MAVVPVSIGGQNHVNGPGGSRLGRPRGDNATSVEVDRSRSPATQGIRYPGYLDEPSVDVGGPGVGVRCPEGQRAVAGLGEACSRTGQRTADGIGGVV